MTSQREKCERFRDLHQGDTTFVIPNPWDAGSARLLQGLGFDALATTSAGFAFTLAQGDGKPDLEQKLEHCRSLAAATDVPINADFEDGYADTPEGVAANIAALAATGVAGCSIEDFSRVDGRLYERSEALQRLQAAVAAVRALDVPFQLTARCENLLRGVDDLEDTIERLQAYQDAGADVLYAPGIRSLDDLATVTAAIARPFNVLGVFMPQATLADFAAAGARRVSLGGALTWAALAPLLEAGREMREQGTFGWLGRGASGAEVARLLKS